VPTRAEQRAETRRALLAEGRRRFARDGYHAVVLEEVARGIGATKGAAYHHFGSKAGLFRAVVEEAQQRVGERVAAAAAAFDEPWDQLVAGCRAFLSAGSDPELQRILLLDAPTVLGWNEWRAMDEAASAHHLGEALEAVMAAGLIARQPVAPLTRLLSGAMNEAALWIAGSPDPAAAVEAAMGALTHLLDGLRTDRP
jgi:AcrR family transcriptional regulator